MLCLTKEQLSPWSRKEEGGRQSWLAAAWRPAKQHLRMTSGVHMHAHTRERLHVYKHAHNVLLMGVLKRGEEDGGVGCRRAHRLFDYDGVVKGIPTFRWASS